MEKTNIRLLMDIIHQNFIEDTNMTEIDKTFQIFS